MPDDRTQPFVSYSQHGEDRRILELIDPHSARYAVDVGANDGQSWSNTYAFGLMGYNLLLVEPMPVYANRCRDLYAGNDRVIVENVAISSEQGQTTFYVSDDARQDELAMRSSLLRDAVPYQAVQEITVQTVGLESLLVRHRWPERYAFLSVDAEGCDLQVLETAGLDHFRPSVICVEEGQHSEAIKGYLATHGYARNGELGPNGLYQPI